MNVRRPVPMESNDVVTFRQKHYTGPTMDSCNGEQYKRLVYGKITLTCMQPDNTVIFKDRRVMLVSNIIESRNEAFLIGSIYEKKRDLYRKPISSSVLDIF